MHILKKCPCIHKDFKDYFSSDDEEDDALESTIYDRVKNDWEWLSLRYERKLNGVLSLVKSCKHADNKINNINLSTFLSFTPKLLQNHLHNILVSNTEWKGESLDDKPFDDIFDGNAAVMFCDISGFTRLVEMIENSEDLESVSNLGQFLNNFFDPLINLIHFYNGDIIKFSGDALLSIFYPMNGPKQSEEQKLSGDDLMKGSDQPTNRSDKDKLETYIQSVLDHEQLDTERLQRTEQDTCINCLKCCRDLHNILNNYPMPLHSPGESAEESKIKLHIGCSYGRIKMKCVGGIFERYEYYLMGEPLNELSILSAISKSDQTVISQHFYSKIENEINVQAIEHNNNTYYEFLSLKEDDSADKLKLTELGSVIDERETSIDGLSEDESQTAEDDSVRSNLSELSRWHDSRSLRRDMKHLNNYYQYISQNSDKHKYLLKKDKESFINTKFYSKQLSDSLRSLSSQFQEHAESDKATDYDEAEPPADTEHQEAGSMDGSEPEQQDTPVNDELSHDKQLRERFKQRYIKILSSFMPRYIFNKLMNGFNIHNNEMRKITIVFANFEFVKPTRRHQSTWNNQYIQEAVKEATSKPGSNLDPEHADSAANDDQINVSAPVSENKHTTEPRLAEHAYLTEQEIERKINTIMKICQKACYSFEGSINKLLLDDKGLIILMIMGFPPLFHEDDALRAIFCGLKIAKDTRKIDVNVGIGITTGRVWCGTLGNNIRKEYTALGDLVNVSCRLMSNAMKMSTGSNAGSTGNSNTSSQASQPLYNILIDNSTFSECQQFIEMVELEPIRLKGKSEVFRVYTPTGKLFDTPKSHIFDHINAKNTISNFTSGGLKHSNIASLNRCSSGASISGLNGSVAMRLLDELYSINGVSLSLLSSINSLSGSTLFINCNDSNNNQLIFHYITHLLSESINSDLYSSVASASVGSSSRDSNNNNNNINESSDSNSNNSKQANNNNKQANNNNKQANNNNQQLSDPNTSFEQQMELLKSRYSNYKILTISHNKNNKLIYNELEDAYKMLILDIMNIWSNSSTRSDFYQCHPHATSTSNPNEHDPLTDPSASADAHVESKLLKELLDPRLHWNLSILNRVISNLKHNNHLLSLLFYSDASSDTSVIRHLYNSFGSVRIDGTSDLTSPTDANGSGKATDGKSTTPGHSGNIGLATNGSSAINVRDSDELEAELEKKLLLLVEKERLNISDYIYSLIEGINLHYPVILIVNASHDKPSVEDNKLISKLLRSSCAHGAEHCPRSHGLCDHDKKELVSLVINFSHSPGETHSFNRTNTININYSLLNNYLNSNGSNEDAHDPSQQSALSIPNLTPSEIKTLLTNIASNEHFSSTKLNNTDELVDHIFNTTNGLYYFTFRYINSLLNPDSAPPESHDEHEDANSDQQEGHTTRSLEQLEKEVTNYLKYKLDQLEPKEQFAIKILTLLDKPVTAKQLSRIIGSNKNIAPAAYTDSSDSDHKESTVSFEHHYDEQLIIKKLMDHNLLISTEDSSMTKDDNVNEPEADDLDSKSSSEVKYYVNNRILKKIINDRILSEEKTHIINDYLVHYA